MKKKIIYAFTAATVLAVTAAQPMTAMAANSTYMIFGTNQNKMVIGGGNYCDVDGLPGNWELNCDNQGNHKPGNHKPGNQRPGNQRPGNQRPENQRPENQRPENQNPETQKPGVQDAWAQQVVTLVNRERVKAGLSELKINQNVSNAAQLRAQELTSNFSHTRPDGSSFSTVLKEAGVSYTGTGENIAYGQSSPEAVMEQWMNSSGHRSNILNPEFTEIGVGHYESASGVHYWTQLFIK